jgi:hypothetical protein
MFKRFRKIFGISCIIGICFFSWISIVAAHADILMIALFSGLKEKALPSEWEIKEWKGKADVQIVKDGAGDDVLHLRSKESSTALYKKMDVNIKDSPYINWRWKVTRVPSGGDVREKSKDDQAAQVYVIFPKFPEKINSRMLGYIWDASAPVGSEVTSTKFSKIKYVVLRSGEDGLGKWFSEKRNVYEDYKRLFGEEPPMVGSVALMIDSDNTRSSAESFFGDIYLSRE